MLTGNHPAAMIALPLRQPLTGEEYLAYERSAPFKTEFINGELYAMAGGSVPHNTAAGNLFAAIHARLRGGSCRVFNSDMKVHVPGRDTFVYPDVSALCGSLRLHDEQRDVLLNPSVIAEVLSPATELYDRNVKFDQYRRLDSLREFLLVAQHRMRVEIWTRRADLVWEPSPVFLENPADVLRLPAVGCDIPLSEIYENVEFPARP